MTSRKIGHDSTIRIIRRRIKSSENFFSPIKMLKQMNEKIFYANHITCDPITSIMNNSLYILCFSISECIMKRMLNFFYHIDIIYSFTSFYRTQTKLLKDLHGMSTHVSTLGSSETSGRKIGSDIKTISFTQIQFFSFR